MTPEATSPPIFRSRDFRTHGIVWGIVTVAVVLGVVLIGFVMGHWMTDADTNVVELPARAADAASLAPLAAPPSQDADMTPRFGPGLAAPDFTAQTPDGQTVRLSDFRGRPVLLNFWATWCTPCAIEMPALEQIHRRYKDQGLVVLGVNQAEPAERVTQYLKANDLTFGAVLDTDTAIARQFRVTGYPTTWLVNADGTLRQLRRGAFLDVSQVERMVADVVNRK